MHFSKLELPKEKLYFSEKHSLYRDCENENAKFSFKLMPFLNEKRKKYQIGANEKYFQRSFKRSKISTTYLKIH